jgi:hypothetical protein
MDVRRVPWEGNSTRSNAIGSLFVSLADKVILTGVFWLFATSILSASGAWFVGADVAVFSAGEFCQLKTSAKQNFLLSFWLPA